MASDNVIERINTARRIIAETDFTKSGTVTGGQKYNFIPIAQILDAVRKAHASAGVTVTFGIPEYDTGQFEKRYSYQKKSQYGETTWFAANGHIHATIYGSSVNDRIEMDVPFEAQDNSDKLTNKIITNAERCLYRVLYAIDEGDATDPEAFNYQMEDAPKQTRAEKMANDPFFAKRPSPDTEASFVTADKVSSRSQTEWDAIAGDCKKAILEWLEEDQVMNAVNEVWTHYNTEHGVYRTWQSGLWIQVYKELKADGAKLKEVAL
ncbi:MAG: hypothetical protein E7Z65_06215 [Thermoplasmata archaeon]|nr:hypothetical protein [Thermoplasmata archaeon]